MNNQQAIKSMRNLDDLISITESEHESVRMAISALTQLLNDGWISVDRELPSSDGRFEVTIKGTRGKRHVEICNFHKNAKGYPWGSKWDSFNVLAWRKRPEPWEGDIQ